MMDGRVVWQGQKERRGHHGWREGGREGGGEREEGKTEEREEGRDCDGRLTKVYIYIQFGDDKIQYQSTVGGAIRTEIYLCEVFLSMIHKV